MQTAIQSVSLQQFRANSIYDPDLTGIGHQPMGHDQYQALYKKYRVKASKIEIWYQSQTSGNIQQIAIYPSPDGDVPTSNTDVFESPLTKTTYISDLKSDGRGYLTSYVTSNQVFGSSALAKDQDCAANFGSNPSKEWYWHVYGISPGVNNIDLRFTVRITYYTEVYDPITLHQS